MGVVLAPRKWSGGDKSREHAHTRPKDRKRRVSRQRDGGGPATEAETNGLQESAADRKSSSRTLPECYCCYYY